jgi:hypothetical protein
MNPEHHLAPALSPTLWRRGRRSCGFAGFGGLMRAVGFGEFSSRPSPPGEGEALERFREVHGPVTQFCVKNRDWFNLAIHRVWSSAFTRLPDRLKAELQTKLRHYHCLLKLNSQ